MCTIAYKPQGISMPSWEHLQNGFDKNDDGAGFAIIRNGLIHLEKGFFDWTSFKSAIKGYKIQKDDIAVFHMRLATHGGVSLENTQPFPVSDKAEDLDAISLTTEGSVFAHNGMFQSFWHERMSDSAVFVSELLSSSVDRVLDNPAIAKLYDGYVLGSKTIIMRADKTVHLSGMWQDKDGIKWSNTDYQPCVVNHYGYGYWNRGSSSNYTYDHPNRNKIGFKNNKFNNQESDDKTYTLYCMTCDHHLYSQKWNEVCPECGDWMLEESELDDFFSEPEPMVCISCGMAYTQAENKLEPNCPECGGLLVKDSEMGEQDDDEDCIYVDESEIKKQNNDRKFAVCAGCSTEYPYDTTKERCDECNGIIIANIPLKDMENDNSKATDLYEKICTNCGAQFHNFTIKCPYCACLVRGKYEHEIIQRGNANETEIVGNS